MMEFPDTPDDETGTNTDDAGGPPEWWEEDGDRLNEMFFALSDDPLEWAEHDAEMRDWSGEGGGW